jgi:hypothetical protein
MHNKIVAEQVNARLQTLQNDNRANKILLRYTEAENETLNASVKALTEKCNTLTEKVVTLTAVVDHAVTGFWGLLSERYTPPLQCSLHPSTCRHNLKLFTPRFQT